MECDRLEKERLRLTPRLAANWPELLSSPVGAEAADEAETLLSISWELSKDETEDLNNKTCEKRKRKRKER